MKRIDYLEDKWEDNIKIDLTKIRNVDE